MGSRLSDSKNRAVQLLADFQTKKDEIVFGSKVPDVYYGFTNNLSVRKSTMDRFGPFEERARGADVIFVQRVVSGLGCDAVSLRQADVSASCRIRQCHVALQKNVYLWEELSAFSANRAYTSITRW
jgi:hypothetical protein